MQYQQKSKNVYKIHIKKLLQILQNVYILKSTEIEKSYLQKTKDKLLNFKFSEKNNNPDEEYGRLLYKKRPKGQV